MARRLDLSLVLGMLAAACGNDELSSNTTLQPPDTDGYDPSNGIGSNGYYSTTNGPADDSGGGSVDDTGAPVCADADKRCPHGFTLADDGYATVEVFGDWADDGWDVGVPLTKDGASWSATVGLPYGQEVLYKFRIDGETWITDPANADVVTDMMGNENSHLQASTCEDWTCEPEVLGTFDWRDAVLYFAFVDRFSNGDPSNDDPIGVQAAADFQGGDWAGITAQIEAGYFEDLGVNALWLSVPMDNPDQSGLGTDGKSYSAYHGYWPARLDQPEEHFGTLAELQTLVDTAHQHGLKVVFDYAMNHVHISSPVYAEHESWFWPNDNGSGDDCVCGSGCDWEGPDARRCWFTPYLPDFDFTQADARTYSIDRALQWIADTGADGFRLDAVKHIEDAWLLELRERVVAEVEPETGEHFYMVGETYTGDRSLIAHYVGADMLDGQFDFPLRMQLARNVLMRQGGMAELATFMDGNDDYYAGAIMSTFIGNHDIPRAIHLAQDTPLWNDPWADGKDRAWTGQPGLPGGTAAFERLANAFAIVATTRGVPLVYYGDEYGMPGAGDPDNRRFMQWDGHSAGQQWLRDRIARLLELRAQHPAMRRGTRTTIVADTETMAYSVSYGGDTVLVAINRSDSARQVGGLPSDAFVDQLTGDSIQGPTVSLPPRSTRILTKP